METFIASAALAFITGLTFVAYNHPRQFLDFLAPLCLGSIMLCLYALAIIGILEPRSFGAEFVLNMRFGELGLWLAVGLFWLKQKFFAASIILFGSAIYIWLLKALVSAGVNYRQRF